MPVTKKTSFLTFSPGRQVSRPRDAESGSNLVRKNISVYQPFKVIENAKLDWPCLLDDILKFNYVFSTFLKVKVTNF